MAVLGYSNTGKTTFIEALLQRVQQQRWHATVLKFSQHPGDFDRSGSDTERFGRAGATVTAYRSRERWVVQVNRPEDPGNTLPPWFEMVAATTDLLILEGRTVPELTPGAVTVLMSGNATRIQELKYDPATIQVLQTACRELAGEVHRINPEVRVTTTVEDTVDATIALLKEKEENGE